MITPDVHNDNLARKYAATRVVSFLDTKAVGKDTSDLLLTAFQKTPPSKLGNNDAFYALAVLYFTAAHRLCNMYNSKPPEIMNVFLQLILVYI